MIFHISSERGVVAAVDRLFHIIQDRYDASCRILYVNNTTSAALSQALKLSKEPWTKQQQRMELFEYERFTSVFQLLNSVSRLDFDLLVVEHMDALMQETSERDYASQNAALQNLMSTLNDMIMIDTWVYLDTYYVREPL